MLEHDSWQARSGIFSVFFRKNLKPLLQEIEVAFATAGRVVYKPASGATMVFSGDGRFIVKKIREEEFAAMIEMMTDLNHHAGLEEEQQCARAACWAEAALGSTALNLPLLAFRDGTDPWFVMPRTTSLRAYIQTDNSTSEGPYGPPVCYDVKPFWAASDDRPTFLRFLTENDLTLEDKRGEWRTLQNTLARDANFLDSFKPPMVDYSLLFEVYHVDANYTQYPWKNCVSSHNGTDIHVMCVSIIDYFLPFNSLWKTVESTVIWEKWHDYGNKVKNLVHCIGGFKEQSAGKLRIMGASPNTEYIGTPSRNAPGAQASFQYPADFQRVLIEGTHQSLFPATTVERQLITVKLYLPASRFMFLTSCQPMFDSACKGIELHQTDHKNGALECRFRSFPGLAHACRADLLLRCFDSGAML